MDEVAGAGAGVDGQRWAVEEIAFLVPSGCRGPVIPVPAHIISTYSSESPAKRKSKAKIQRKWGDEPVTESDMASLDFSSDKYDSTANGDVGSHDLQALVDQSSLGTRTRDGLYEVKDWDFSKHDDTDMAIANALRPAVAKVAAQPSSLGALGSIFARLTGSKILSEADLRPVLEGMKQHLMKKNVAKEIADKVCEGVGESLIGKKVGGLQSKSICALVWCPTISAI